VGGTEGGGVGAAGGHQAGGNVSEESTAPRAISAETGPPILLPKLNVSGDVSGGAAGADAIGGRDSAESASGAGGNAASAGASASSQAGAGGAVDDQPEAKVQVRVFNVDDIASLYLNGNLILSETYLQDSGLVDITTLLLPGDNTVRMVETNLLGGWTYGFEVSVGGTPVFRSECGTASILGCENNDGKLGVVYDQSFALRAP
jgi:hypothetical protein